MVQQIEKEVFMKSVWGFSFTRNCAVYYLIWLLKNRKKSINWSFFHDAMELICHHLCPGGDNNWCHSYSAFYNFSIVHKSYGVDILIISFHWGSVWETNMFNILRVYYAISLGTKSCKNCFFNFLWVIVDLQCCVQVYSKVNLLYI